MKKMYGETFMTKEEEEHDHIHNPAHREAPRIKPTGELYSDYEHQHQHENEMTKDSFIDSDL